MTLAASLARNTAIQTVGKVLSIALGWAMVLMMTNSLGAHGFGEFTIMTAYMQFFAVAADFGFVLVSAQLFAERPDDHQRLFANLFTFRLVTAGTILALGAGLVWFFPYSLVVRQGVMILGVSFLLSALIQILTGLNQQQLTMTRVVVGELISRAVVFAFIVWAVWAGRGLLTMVAGVIAGASANYLYLLLTARHRVHLSLAFDWDLWGEIWQRSWPLMATIVFNLIYLKADTLILSLTRSAAEVGVYGAVYRIFEVLITFPTMFAGLLLPVLSAARAAGEHERMDAIARRGFAVLIYAAVPMIVATMFLAEPVVRLFGEEFVASGPLLLRMLVVANAAVFFGTYFAHLVVVANEQRAMIWSVAAVAAIGLVGYLVFIPLYGAVAAAALTVSVEGLYAALMYRVMRRRTSFAVSWGQPLVVACFGAVPMAVMLLTFESWALGAVFGGLCYVAVLWWRGVFQFAELFPRGA